MVSMVLATTWMSRPARRYWRSSRAIRAGVHLNEDDVGIGRLQLVAKVGVMSLVVRSMASE